MRTSVTFQLKSGKEITWSNDFYDSPDEHLKFMTDKMVATIGNLPDRPDAKWFTSDTCWINMNQVAAIWATREEAR